MGALGFALLETLTYQKKNFICWLKNPFIPFAALICFGALISITNASYWEIAFIEILQQLFVITVFLSLIWILVRRGKIKLIIFAFISSGVLTACIATLDFFTGSRYGPLLSSTPNVNFWGRYAGTLGHPNKFGFFLVLTALLTIGFWLDGLHSQKRSPLYNFSWGSIFLIQVFGVYLSNSITAYVGLMVGIFVYGNVKLAKKGLFIRMPWASPLLLLIMILVIIIFTLPYIKTSGAYGFIQTGVERVINTTSEGRIVVYKLAWSRILKNPLIGVGYDQISTSGINLVQSILGTSVHNALLEIWYTGGLFAFIGWLAIYIYLGWFAVKVIIGKVNQSPIVISLVSAVLSALVMDQFQDSIYQREKWLVFGLFVAWCCMQDRIRKSTLNPNINEIKIRNI